MQPIPTLSSPIQLSDIHTKMIAQTPMIFRPYNHFPITITPTLNTINTKEPRVSAFKVVRKRPKIADVTLETPMKFCRTEPNHYNSLDLSKLINRNCIDDGKPLSMPNSYNSTIPNVEPNALCPLNLKKNTLHHETITHSMCTDSFEMPCDLTVHHHQQPQPKFNNSYQNDVKLHKPVIQYRYVAQGNF